MVISKELAALMIPLHVRWIKEGRGAGTGANSKLKVKASEDWPAVSLVRMVSDREEMGGVELPQLEGNRSK